MSNIPKTKDPSAVRILLRIFVMYIGPVLFSFLLGSVFLISVDKNPLNVYIKLVFGPFKNSYWISELILKITPLLLCSLAVTLALKVGFWNIGVEGQFCMGAWAAGGIALYFGKLPGYILLPFMMLAGFACGGIWCSIPALLKTKLRVNEIITTLLMNYIAALWLNHFIYGRWKGEDGFPYTRNFTENAALPRLFGQRAHIGIFFGILISAVLFFVFTRTRFGYKMRVTGKNIFAARYGGINVTRIFLVTAIFSGGIAGLAGMTDVSGIHHRLHPNILLGYGYTAIIIAWLSKNKPLSILVVSFLFGILAVGGDIIQVYQVPNAIVKILQGFIFLSVLAGDEIWKRISNRV
ncbi:ABC transporter permease [Candidatus Poribacteria bacterium]|nr:ABC transporter permease [Candidatus Poribacteria bacterium]